MKFNRTYMTFRLQWVEIYGTKYKKGAIVVLDMDLVPEFGIISEIIVLHTDQYYFACETLYTHCFESHLHSYLVSHDHSYTIIKQADLYDFVTLSVYNINSNLYIPLKYQLVDRIL